MPPMGYSFNVNVTGFEEVVDTAFGDKNVQNVDVVFTLTASNVGVSDERYKLKQIIFGWRDHTVVIQESAITPDDVDVVFFEMPDLFIFDDESPDAGDEIYLFLCTGSGVTVVPPSVSGLYSGL